MAMDTHQPAEASPRAISSAQTSAAPGASSSAPRSAGAPARRSPAVRSSASSWGGRCRRRSVSVASSPASAAILCTSTLPGAGVGSSLTGATLASRWIRRDTVAVMFDHVAIRASDRAASERFYRTVLATLEVEPTTESDAFTAWHEFDVIPASPGKPLDPPSACRLRCAVAPACRRLLARRGGRRLRGRRSSGRAAAVPARLLRCLPA